MRLYGDLYDPNEDAIVTVTISEDVENEARLERMSVSEYVKAVAEDNPQFMEVYTVGELEEDDYEATPCGVDEWMAYNGLSWSDFI